jgi:sulfur relay (sulfurtransferase) DsrC/TusE family protein
LESISFWDEKETEVLDFDGCMERIMSPAQKEVFLVVDEWWKRFGFSPTLRDIAEQRGKSGLASTKAIVDRLVKQGVLKKKDRMGRTIRPVYIRYRNVE